LRISIRKKPGPGVTCPGRTWSGFHFAWQSIELTTRVRRLLALPRARGGVSCRLHVKVVPAPGWPCARAVRCRP
jgi:hypothetical protein